MKTDHVLAKAGPMGKVLFVLHGHTKAVSSISGSESFIWSNRTCGGAALIGWVRPS